MKRLAGLVLWMTVLVSALAGAANSVEFDKDYLYYRDAHVPQFQKSREFFDMPNRPGRYEVLMISESAGPLTFRVVRVKDEHEKTEVRKRSYRIGNHEFQTHFDNPSGKDDLIVEISNSNPAVPATVSVYVVEMTDQ